MKRIVFLTIMLAGISLTSCRKEIIRGNGDIVSVTRDTDNFNAVEVSGKTAVFITQGAEFKVEVTGYANLVDRFQTKVQNNILHLGYRNISVTRDNIEVHITMPELTGNYISGTSKMEINGNFPEVSDYVAEISGTGKIFYLGSGSSNNLKINLSGTGEVDFYNLAVKNVDATISGTGHAKVSASDNIEVEISGNAKLYYKGNPVINSKISGKGEIIKQ